MTFCSCYARNPIACELLDPGYRLYPVWVIAGDKAVCRQLNQSNRCLYLVIHRLNRPHKWSPIDWYLDAPAFEHFLYFVCHTKVTKEKNKRTVKNRTGLDFEADYKK